MTRTYDVDARDCLKVERFRGVRKLRRRFQLIVLALQLASRRKLDDNLAAVLGVAVRADTAAAFSTVTRKAQAMVNVEASAILSVPGIEEIDVVNFHPLQRLSSPQQELAEMRISEQAVQYMHLRSVVLHAHILDQQTVVLCQIRVNALGDTRTHQSRCGCCGCCPSHRRDDHPNAE